MGPFYSFRSLYPVIWSCGCAFFEDELTSCATCTFALVRLRWVKFPRVPILTFATATSGKIGKKDNCDRGLRVVTQDLWENPTPLFLLLNLPGYQRCHISFFVPCCSLVTAGQALFAKNSYQPRNSGDLRLKRNVSLTSRSLPVAN